MVVKLIQVHEQLSVDLLVRIPMRKPPHVLAETVHHIILGSCQILTRLLGVELPNDFTERLSHGWVREPMYHLMLDSLFAYLSQPLTGFINQQPLDDLPPFVHGAHRSVRQEGQYHGGWRPYRPSAPVSPHLGHNAAKVLVA
jgi:hypothetical protein